MMFPIIPFAAAAAATPEAAFERYRTEINSHDFDRLAATVLASDVVFVFTAGVAAAPICGCEPLTGGD